MLLLFHDDCSLTIGTEHIVVLYWIGPFLTDLTINKVANNSLLIGSSRTIAVFFKHSPW